MAKINKVKIYDQWYDIEDSIHFLSNGTISTTASHYITESMNREDFPMLKEDNISLRDILKTLKARKEEEIEMINKELKKYE